jgi:hypothetical protein
MKDRRKDRSDGKARKRREQPLKKTLEFIRPRSHSVETYLWKKVRYRPVEMQTDYRIVMMITLVYFLF